MERRNFLVSTVGLFGTAAVGSLAYNQATVNRDVSVQVNADDSADAQMQLQSGPAGGTEIKDAGNQLVLNGKSASNGLLVTPDGTFTFGDASDPTNVYAFSVTNNLDNQKEYAVTASVEPTDALLNIDFYNASGSQIGSSAQAALTTGTTQDVEAEVTATIPSGTGIDLTFYEDADPSDNDDTADYQQTISLQDGTNAYALNQLDLTDESDVWLEAEFFEDENASSPELESVTLVNQDDTSIGSIDSAGQIFALGAGETAYAVLTIETVTDDTDVTGKVEISSADSASF